LSDLTNELAVEEEPICIGQAFENMAFYLKTYKMYCNDYEESRKILGHLKTNSQFEQFFAKLHESPDIGKSTIKDYLIMPVQRIPRYRLLLMEILKYTWESHPDYENLKAALKNISETAMNIEEAQEKVENMNQIIAVQNRLKSKKHSKITLLEPGRTFLAEELCQFRQNKANDETWHKRKLFLFNDLMLITKVTMERDAESKKKTQFYHLQDWVSPNDLSNLTVEDNNVLSLKWGQQDLEIQFSEPKTCTLWEEKLRKLICQDGKNPLSLSLSLSLSSTKTKSPTTMNTFQKRTFRKSKQPPRVIQNEVVVTNPLLGLNMSSDRPMLRSKVKKRGNTLSIDESKRSTIPIPTTTKRRQSVGSVVQEGEFAEDWPLRPKSTSPLVPKLDLSSTMGGTTDSRASKKPPVRCASVHFRVNPITGEPY